MNDMTVHQTQVERGDQYERIELRTISVYRTEHDEALGLPPLFTYDVTVRRIKPGVKIENISVLYSDQGFTL